MCHNTLMLPNRRLTKEQKAQVVSDYLAGLPLKIICKKYGISRTTIYRILKITIN